MGQARRWPVLAVLLAGLVVVVVGAVVLRPWAGEAGTGPVATGSPEPDPPPVLVAGDPSAPAATAAGIRAAIDALVRDEDLGDRVSASVVDAATGEELYGHRAGAPAVPASTTKLVTAAAVLATFAPAHRIPTVAVAGAEPGEVVLVGGGDPTLAVDGDGFFPGAARLDELAAQVGAARGGAPVTSVTVDASLFTGPVHGPWDPDIPGGGYVGPITALLTDGARTDPDPDLAQQSVPRWPEPDVAAGQAFAALLGADPDTVTRGTAPAPPSGRRPSAGSSAAPPPGPSAAPPPGPSAAPSADAPAAGPSAGPSAAPAPGTELGRVLSPPVLRVVELMLTTSDNVVAEALARQVALARGEPASFAGAAAATAGALAELGLPLAGDNGLADGSGLSRDNALAAGYLTGLLTTVARGDQPALAGIAAGLPVAGWSGTLAERYRESGRDAAAGVVRAKTGTLTGVNALAGLVTTADGRLLAFALLADDVSPPDQLTAVTVLDEIATTLAACGCR